MTESSTPTLSNEQLGEVLRLIKGADTVEFKLTVPDARPRVGRGRARDGRARRPDPPGRVLRHPRPDAEPARRRGASAPRAGQRGDTVVKLRPIDPADVPPKVRKDPGFGIEVDAMPGGFVCSGSMKATLDDYRVKETFAGSRPLSKLLTKEQRRFFADHAPEGVALDDLATLGPDQRPQAQVHARRVRPPPGGRTVALPRRRRACSSCRRSARRPRLPGRRRTKAFLAGRGIDLSGAQATKTRTGAGLLRRPARSRRLMMPTVAVESGSPSTNERARSRRIWSTS